MKSTIIAGFAAAGLGAIALTAVGYAQGVPPAPSSQSQIGQTPAGGKLVTGTTSPASAQSRRPAAKAVAPAAKQEAAAPQTSPVAAIGPEGFQTSAQLQQAGVKRCLGLAEAVGRATMAGSNQYAAVSTWNSKQPDGRFSVSMIGQQFQVGPAAIPNALSGVFSVPTPEGKCDAASVQVIPTADPCTTVQAQILVNGRTLGNLAGVPLLQNAANAQVMLLPGANNSCVLVALSTVYTE